MSNQYPTGYPSSGLMNSPHSYSGSPGPISMPNMSTGMGPGNMGNMSGAMPTNMTGMSGMGSMTNVLTSSLGNSMTPMSQGLGPPMTTGMGSAMQGMSPLTNSMVPMPMQFSMGPTQTTPPQGASGLAQGNGPSTTPNSSTCDSVASSAGSNPRIATPGAAPDGTQTSQSTRDINTASLCRIGQETVQDIISRTQEIFQTLKTLQPPNGTPAGSNAAKEKKIKVQEQLRTIRILFKRLRLIFEKCNDNSQLQGMEYTHIESLIPLKDEWDGKSEERRNSEAYRQAVEEHKELIEAVVAKNRVLKDIIDHMRRIIWEINTMLMMRRS